MKQFVENVSIPDITPQNVEAKNFHIEDDISVEVSTIHSVKGETHFATLYLETSYYDNCESERIMNYLLGNYITPIQERVKETLKMSYVGMSRPQYMLCLAIHKNNYDCRMDKKNGGLWEIIRLS